ncbi:redoxin domain-containing protein [Gilvimarinus sp. SDUM040013]|uniref:Redoxin domain-containing protein n=1 Tax=Gilvimarinus gilvus TaxID=3058038 RepID=A0ABU4S1B0_9GAMM|nr:redoxin domain-containing protein [Gilvimarinus sp. SDUM040013]MDO3385358.1 redoxin domain-containing protein [Gilvimarinus sp. SDUM040013]MDX6850933.1 redoxin domain-containing protein [Gilvimarinus sp. SDUM040013]
MNILKQGLLASILTVPALAFAVATPGEAAPDFSEVDATGEMHALSDYQGEWLVLEWFNKDCPYVRKHYGSGNMQSLQEKYTAQDVNWLTVISSAEGKQGYLGPVEAQNQAKIHNLNASAPFLLDPDGNMGRDYGAKTTPHMFIINPEGDVVYAGAIDDNDSANPAVIPESNNYVVAALDAALAGKPVAEPSTRAYGCSVKY